MGRRWFNFSKQKGEARFKGKSQCGVQCVRVRACMCIHTGSRKEHTLSNLVSSQEKETQVASVCMLGIMVI